MPISTADVDWVQKNGPFGDVLEGGLFLVELGPPAPKYPGAASIFMSGFGVLVRLNGGVTILSPVRAVRATVSMGRVDFFVEMGLCGMMYRAVYDSSKEKRNLGDLPKGVSIFNNPRPGTAQYLWRCRFHVRKRPGTRHRREAVLEASA